ncbi:unannotated protein [freshwater metagenome]|uniref:Unannotated protein n=1 Tax=freshwater metagenome TaxID=449393 RepID=A0A6J7L2J8_9ZZZZ|nr:hypothetical protein [Actinomycetota bacterium]MSW37832.1 hypothetical protein [Actinomycetota bacterium]
MAVAAPELTPQVRRFETERIHASPTVLILAAIGLAIWGVGRLVSYGQEGRVVASVGLIAMVIAVVLHVGHLRFRLGRSAVVLLILGVVVDCVGELLAAVGVSGSTTWWVIGVGWVFAGTGVGMVAVHKEGQMADTLAEYAAGAPLRARVTVHASFLSLITAASGLVLYGIGLAWFSSDSGRMPNVLQSAGGVLVAIGVISHVGHLVPRIGRVAVIAAIVAPLCFAANPFPDVIDPENAASHVTFWHVCIGVGALLAALACVLAFQKKLSTDR